MESPIHSKRYFNDKMLGILIIVVAATLALVSPAYGYTDPGSGLLLWQMVGAAFVGSLFYLRRAFGWLKIRRKKRADES